MSITSADGLKKYALMRCGDGAVTVEITPEQESLIIEDALQLFGKYHYDGFKSGFLILSVVDGETSYELDENIIAVTEALRTTTTALGEPTFSLQWDFMQDARYIMSDMDLVGYELLLEKLKMIDSRYRAMLTFNFNPIDHIINFTTPPGVIDDSSVYILKVFTSLDSSTVTGIFNEEWMKKYVYGRFLEQWGANLDKYSGVPLPGNSQLNGEKILERGSKIIEECMEELKTKYSLPIDFFYA